MTALLAAYKHALRKLRLRIVPDWLVLDVGSGNNPHFRADVLCDRYLTDTERQGALRIDRPMVRGDVQNLPFKDGAFDYVICCHLLEHVQNPEMAVRELTRVASRGYVETPSEFGEKVGGAPFHRWFVRLENGTLVFTEKTKHPFDDLVAGTLYRLTLARDRSYSSFYHSRFDLFVNCLEWEADLPVIVHRSEKPYVMPVGDSLPEKADFQHFGLVKRLLRATMGGRAHIPAWTELLQSTCCKASVRATQDGFECTKCGRQFRNTNGVPSFIE